MSYREVNIANALNYNRYILVFGLTLVLSAVFVRCSTEKNAWLNRSFHNTTARYNGYFNAGELMKEAVVNYQEGYKEDFNELLPIFIYADEKGSKSLYPAMDTAIKKCATVINKHSMPEKKEGKFAKTEWCQWIDDNWFIIGQANFHKNDFEVALEMFEFVMDQYELEEISYDSKLWATKTLIEMQNFDAASKYLKQLDKEAENAILEAENDKKKENKNRDRLGISKRNNRGAKGRSKYKKKGKKKQAEEVKVKAPFPEEMAKEVQIVFADLHIRQEDWPKAIERINKAILLKPKKATRTRLYFILAQLYQKTGDANQANDAYTQVIKSNPTYEMTFYSKINRALSGGGNKLELKKELLAMARDDKNVDYLDQIYYALGDLELQENNRDQGISYLKKSAEKSDDNIHQKTKTYLRLADLFFEDKNYEVAQAYYDSTARVVLKKHPQHDIIKAKNKSLTTLVENMRQIALQDSLQRIGKLSKEEQEELVLEIIENLKAEEERVREERLQKQIQDAMLLANNAGKGGKFWVYNTQLKSSGFAEFKKKWGDREKEDDWRRSNKAEVMVVNMDGFDPDEEDSTSADVAERYNPRTYLKNIPQTAADYEKSDALIIKAIYGEGVVYKDDLKDYKEATNSFKELIRRFPDAERTPAAVYQLYRIGILSSAVSSEQYKNYLLTEFPTSQYAQLIIDPKYLEKRKKEQDKLKNEYREYYKEYKRGNYQAVILKANEVATDTTMGEFRCQYLYLKALSIGRITPPVINPEPFEKALTDVIKSCRKTGVGKDAQKTLDLMRNQTTITDADEGESTYIYESGTPHFFIYVHDKSTGSINPIKMSVSNFNGNSFSSKGLVTSSNFLNATKQLVMVKSFATKDEAMDYFIAFKVNNTSVKRYNKENNFFVISGKNYASLLIEKEEAAYQAFFIKNYMD